MKILVCKVNTSKNKRTGRYGVNVERLLLISSLAIFSLLIVIQILLMNPSVSAVLSANNQLDGEPLEAENYMYEHGEIELQLTSSKGDDNIKVLVNGDEAACFDNRNVVLKVKDGDVVEIDGSQCENEFEVTAVYKSSNIATDILNKSIRVHSSINSLGKIYMQ